MPTGRLKYIFCSTGHCGSRYVSKLLQSAGINCTHEQTFRTQKISRHYVEKMGTEAESSAFAFGYLDDPWVVAQGAEVVHLVRHPLRVMRSWMYSKNGWGQQARPYFTRVLAGWGMRDNYWPLDVQLDSLHTADRDPNWLAAFWYSWNTLIGNAVSLRVQAESKIKILDALGIAVPRDVFDDPKDNHHAVDGVEDLTWECIPDENLRKQVCDLAKEYGYGDHPRD